MKTCQDVCVPSFAHYPCTANLWLCIMLFVT